MPVEKKPEQQFTTITTEHYQELLQGYLELAAAHAEQQAAQSVTALRPDWEAEEKLPSPKYEQNLIDSSTHTIPVEFRYGQYPLEIEFTVETWQDLVGRMHLTIYFAGGNPDYPEFTRLRNEIAGSQNSAPELVGNRMEYEIVSRIKEFFPDFSIWEDLPEQLNRDGKKLGCFKLYSPIEEGKPAHILSLQEVKAGLKQLETEKVVLSTEATRLANTLARDNSTLRYLNQETKQFDGFFLRDVLDRAFILFQNPEFGRAAAYRVLFNRLWAVRNIGPKGAETLTQLILAHFEEVSRVSDSEAAS
jgi:hypothetical protein